MQVHFRNRDKDTKKRWQQFSMGCNWPQFKVKKNLDFKKFISQETYEMFGWNYIKTQP